MSKSFISAIVVNALIAGIFIFLQLGPQKIWKKVLGPTGDISWFWLSVNIGLFSLVLVFVVTSISVKIKSELVRFESVQGSHGEETQKTTLFGLKKELENSASELISEAVDFFKTAERDFEAGRYRDAIKNYQTRR